MRTHRWTMVGLAAAMSVGWTMPARAINKEWSAVAGFVGGVLVANSIRCAPRTERQVVYYEQPVVYRPVERVVIREEPVRRGHYEWRTEQVWVPGRWVYEDTGCGTRRKVWCPGYFTTQRYRVWVDTTCRGW